MKACGKSYHDNSGIALVCTEASPCRECLLVEVGRLEFALREQSPVDPEMPKDRDEHQKLLNKAWRSGNQAAHESYRLAGKAGANQNGVPHDT